MRSIDLEVTVFNELLHWQDLMPKPIKIDVAPESVKEIITETCWFFNVDEKDVMKKGREHENVFIRQCISAVSVHFLKRKGIGGNLQNIGKLLGGRDHATILHGAKAISNCIDSKYRIRTISDVANLFYLSLDDLRYTPNPSLSIELMYHHKKQK